MDLSLTTTFISIVDSNNKIIKEGFVKTDIEQIFNFLEVEKFPNQKICIESGQLSISMCKGLIKKGLNAKGLNAKGLNAKGLNVKGLNAKGLNVICVDARHMAAALSARINKNDRMMPEELLI